ncbi:14155_t:CDS:2 [Acaulospora morrowiae]|uniref:14155_t:CDS:1 n=1 Tax=Acaulospora morrowiae TaxID=94023 RepID=A0A9N9BII1_9GLOM|nr:14155_t:CDS:2 [Acaulospora morrowiae]
MRDPHEENVGKKTKRDQRAFGSPFKNREQKPLPKRTFPKLPPRIRDKLSASQKPVHFPGLPEKGVKPFVIVVGRQITTTIETSTKTRSLKIPTRSSQNQTIKSQFTKISDNNFQSPNTPLSPSSETSESFSFESTSMNVDEGHTPSSFVSEEADLSLSEESATTDSLPTGLDMLASLSTVLTTNQSQTDHGIQDSNEILSNDNADDSATSMEVEHVEAVEKNEDHKDVEVSTLIKDAEVSALIKDAEVSALIKDAEINNLDYLSRAAELVLSQERTGLDMLSQAVSQVTTDMDDVVPNVGEASSASEISSMIVSDVSHTSNGGQNHVSGINQTSGEILDSEIESISRWKSIKSNRNSSLDGEFRLLESSKFAAELRRQIAADNSTYDEASILDLIKNFVVSESYADEIKSKFLYSILKFSRAYNKIELSQNIDTLLQDIRFDLKNYFNDRRMRSMK